MTFKNWTSKTSRLAAWNLCERRYAVEEEVETDADIGWPFLETMVEGVCSSPTGETEMAQTSTKRASWRPSTCSGSRPSQGKVAFGPYCQSDSRKGWACANSWSEDRIFLVIVATHTETLSVRGIREPLPWLRLFRIKNRTLTLFLPVINPINRFFGGNSRLTCYL